MNFWYIKMFLARNEFRNILEVRSVSKCTTCTQMYFSNLMDADRLYNNFVGQEMNVQPTSENSELAGKYTWLCTIYYVRAEHFAFCRYGRTKSQIATWITVLDSGSSPSAAPTQEDVAQWYEWYPNPNIPILQDTTQSMQAWYSPGGWPTVMLIGPDMQVLEYNSSYVKTLERTLVWMEAQQ